MDSNQLFKYLIDKDVLDIDWDDESRINIEYFRKLKQVNITANKKGLEILGKILISMAHDSVPNFHTCHLDVFYDKDGKDKKSFGQLLEGSLNMRITKTDIQEP